MRSARSVSQQGAAVGAALGALVVAVVVDAVATVAGLSLGTGIVGAHVAVLQSWLSVSGPDPQWPLLPRDCVCVPPPQSALHAPHPDQASHAHGVCACGLCLCGWWLCGLWRCG